MPDTPSSLRQLLATSSFFRTLAAGALDLLSSRFEAVVLTPGQTLFRQGEHGDALYVVESGGLDVQVEQGQGTALVVDRLAAGAVVGEMALLTSPVRNATVVARAGGARLWRLARAAFEHLASDHPDLLEHVLEVARPRLERAQLAPLLSEWFGVTGDEALQALQSELTWHAVDQGNTVFRRGDVSGNVYLVVSGRFELCVTDTAGAGTTPWLVGRGETLGEQVVLGDQVREFTAFAVRDSHLVEVPKELAESSPTFMRKLAHAMIKRANQPRAFAADVPISIALLPAATDAPTAALAEALAARMRAWGEVLWLSSATVDERFGREGVAQTQPSAAFDLPLNTWLSQQERCHAYVLLEVDPTFSAWTARCLRRVDAVLVVADADAEAVVGDLEMQAAARRPPLATELVLVHPDEREQPSDTMRWLEPRTLRAHHHVRLGRAPDLDRLARRLAGRAIGLALSGGGARGFVHVGLLRAIEERGLNIDMIVGSSMGAVVGGGYARFQGYEKCYEVARAFGDRKKLLDYTLPIVALTRSRKVSRFLSSVFGEHERIEDQWIPFACVSASLTDSEPRVHRTGSMWRAVRASSAIPGVFTPVLMDGEVLVDGGVMNNFPVDVLRDLLGSGWILASNAYGGKTRGRPMAFGDDVSGWAVLAQKLLPWKRARRLRVPSILGTLMRSTSLSSHHLMSEMDRWADLVVRYPTDDISSLEFDEAERLIELGYQHSTAALDRWHPGEPVMAAPELNP